MFDKFRDYMYYLLISPLKRIKKELNQWYKLFKVLGRRFDDAIKSVYSEGEQSMIASCDDELLSVHAKERKMQRYSEESNDIFRKRIANFQEIQKLGGSDSGVILAVKSLGYKEPKIVPAKVLKGNSDRWAEFYLVLNLDVNGETVEFETLRNEVRKAKYVGAKDNYLFIYNARVKEPHKVNLKVKYRWPIYFYTFRKWDGKFYLDGLYKLDSERISYNLGFDIKLKTNHTFAIKKASMIKQGTVETLN